MRLASVVGGHVDRRAIPAADHPSVDAKAGMELVVPLVGGEVVVTPSAGTDRLVLEGWPGPVAQGPDPDAETSSEAEAAVLRGAPMLLGIGWATVDAERALPAVAAALGLAPGVFRPATGDESLGASAHVARVGPIAVALLEPATEGRVAAALARSGEGPCAIYVASTSAAATQPGPLGPAILAMADRRWGPFVVAVRRRIAAPR